MNRLEAIKKIAKDAHEKNTIGASYFRNSVQGLAIIRILGIDNSNLKLQDDPVQIYLWSPRDVEDSRVPFVYLLNLPWN